MSKFYLSKTLNRIKQITISYKLNCYKIVLSIGEYPEEELQSALDLLLSSWRYLEHNRRTYFKLNSIAFYRQTIISFNNETKLFKPFIELLFVPSVRNVADDNLLLKFQRFWIIALGLAKPNILLSPPIKIYYHINIDEEISMLSKGCIDFDMEELSHEEKEQFQNIIYLRKFISCYGLFATKKDTNI